jgi:heme exporter protein A
MLSVQQLSCERGRKRLFSDLNFQLQPGECLHVQGANGAGKTSLLRIVCGLAEALHGEIRWRGQDTRLDPGAWRAELVYLGHTPGLKDELSAAENLHFQSQIDGCTLSDAQIDAALQRVGLGRQQQVPLRRFSQGQKRRAALARLIACPVALWVLDEPLAALDQPAQQLVAQLLAGHVQAGGLALVTSHQPLGVPCLDLRLGA